MDERSCIELAAALGVTSHGGWRDLVDRVKAISSMPDGPGRVYDQVKAALGGRAGGGGMPWLDLVAEVQATRELADSVKDVTRDLAEAMGMMATANAWPALLKLVRRWRADRETRERVAGSTSDDGECSACGEAICERCNTCHDCTGECDAGSGAEEPTAVSRAVDAMITAMLTSGRDWRVNAVDAWLYGIVIGWDLDEMTDVAERHRWPNGARMRLIELHDAMQEALASVLR